MHSPSLSFTAVLEPGLSLTRRLPVFKFKEFDSSCTGNGSITVSLRETELCKQYYMIID